MTFIVDLANQTTLAEGQSIFILIDSDLNLDTGSDSGFEFVLALVIPDEAGVVRWNGTQFVTVESQSAYGYHHDGFRLAVARSELALTTGTLRFRRRSRSPLESGDASPDNALRSTPLRTRR